MSGEKKVRLTVSLISSGRIDTVERALESVLPLRKALPAEIVVVDTDTERREDVRTILEQYADRIVPFDWCDDFAAARNAQLDVSCGEWFLYLDDDEWLADPQEIVSFLQSGESDAYAAANVSVRNYMTEDLSEYSDMWATRLFRNNGVRFHGMVHEYPDIRHGKVAGIKAAIGHTGYIYLSDTAKKVHAERNITLLERCIVQEPANPRWQMQLLMEYAHGGDFDRQREICRHAMELLEDDGTPYGDVMRGMFAAAWLRVEQKQENWEEEWRLLERFWKEDRFSADAAAYMDFEAVVTAFNRKDYGACIDHGKSYLERYEMLHGSEAERTEDLPYILAETFGDSVFSIVASLLICAEALSGRWDTYDRYFQMLRWDDGAEFDFQGYEGKLLSVMAETDYNERFASMVHAFWKQPSARQVVRLALAGLSAQETGGRWNLARAVYEAELEEDEPWAAYMLWADHAGMDPSGIMTGRIPFAQYRSEVDGFVRTTDSETMAEVLDFLTEWMDGDDMRCRYFCFHAKIWNLIRWDRSYDEPIPETAVPALLAWLRLELGDYAENCLGFFRKLFRESVFEERWDELPDEAVVACRLEKLLALDDRRYKEILSGLRELIGMWPECDGVLRRFSHVYGEAVKQEMDRKSRDGAVGEMQQIIHALQGKVDELVSAGMIDEAQEVLEQIERFMPKVR